MDVDEGGPRFECLVSGLDLLRRRDRDGRVVLLARNRASIATAIMTGAMSSLLFLEHEAIMRGNRLDL